MGQVIWLDLFSKTINYRDSSADLITFIDITSKKETEEALKESEERYHDLLETSSVGIIEINIKENKISYINRKSLEILDYARDELMYEDIKSKIIHPDDINKIFNSSEEKDRKIFD